jgi:hypothetical protein
MTEYQRAARMPALQGFNETFLYVLKTGKPLKTGTHSGKLRHCSQTLDHAGKACHEQTVADYENSLNTDLNSCKALSPEANFINLFNP